MFDPAKQNLLIVIRAGGGTMYYLYASGAAAK
jgi:hypothetical protein